MIRNNFVLYTSIGIKVLFVENLVSQASIKHLNLSTNSRTSSIILRIYLRIDYRKINCMNYYIYVSYISEIHDTNNNNKIIYDKNISS